jgi:pimeloyl-ACP methyl ester carboxylesterase
LVDRHVEAADAVVDGDASVGAAPGGAVGAYRERDGMCAVLERDLSHAAGGVLPQRDHWRCLSAARPTALHHPVRCQRHHGRAGIVSQNARIACGPARVELRTVKQGGQHDRRSDRTNQLRYIVVLSQVLTDECRERQLRDLYKLDLAADNGWHNEVNAAGLLATAGYRPVRRAARIAAPVLLQLGERDAMAPLPPIEQTAARARRSELTGYPIDHFQCFWPEHIDRVTNDQIDFLRRQLLASQAPPDDTAAPTG